MVIAAHICSENISDNPLHISLRLLAEKHPLDHFVLFSGSAPHIGPENIIYVQNSPVDRNVIFQQYWYRFALPGLLKKYEAQVFISDTGLLSSRAQLPQFLFFNDHFFEYQTGLFFKKNFLRSLTQAKKIFTSEDFITQLITEKHTASAEKIKTVYHGLPVIKEQGASAEMIKEKFTDGYDYFLFSADITSARHGITVLKAFSLLKKRLRSSMKMVLLLNDISDEELIPDLKNYKYRDDVLMISSEEKNADMLIPFAYAMIWLSTYTAASEAFIALQSRVPVITEENDCNKSLLGDAAVYSAASETALSEKMQLLYKDEFLKNTIAVNASSLSQKYNSEMAADIVYAGITE